MRKMLLNLLLAFLLTYLFVGSISGQASFTSGNLGITLKNYGQMEVYASNLDTIQIDRFSLLVGTAPNAVFDYNEDAENVLAPLLVGSPSMSDYELRNFCDNSYSAQPPDILEKIFMYGWNGAGYALCKINVTNIGTSSINAINGLEILPQIDAVYGFEIVEYLPAEQMVAIYKPAGTYVGFKFFDQGLVSLHSFEWYEGFNSSDDSLYSYLTYGAFDTLYQSGADGSVAVMSQEGVPIAAGDSVEFYFGISVGSDPAELIANMQGAYERYQVFTGIAENATAIPSRIELFQNYPNPFNPETHISFTITRKEKVTVKIFNMLGQEVQTLVNDELEAGFYDYKLNSGNLPSGIYVYQLVTGNSILSKKMMLLR